MEGRQVELPENFLLRDRFVQSRGYRTILDVYPSDNEGNWQDAGTFAALAMAYGPRYACSSALAADFTDINGHESYVDSVNTITQVQEIPTESGPLTGMIFDHCAKVINHEPEKWLQDVSHDPECPLRYGYFVPRMGTGKSCPGWGRANGRSSSGSTAPERAERTRRSVTPATRSRPWQGRRSRRSLAAAVSSRRSAHHVAE